MKVLLANPPWETDLGYGCRSNTRWPHIRKDKYLIFPIYLAYAAAVLEKNGVGVAVVDAVAEDYGSDAFIARVRAEDPDICFLETSTPSILHDLRNANRIKKELGKKVFIFGAHATTFHRQLMEENPLIDGVIRGEFEHTIRDISLGTSPLAAVQGLTHRENGAITENPARPYIENLDELPFPAWHLFNWKAYESHLYASPSMWVITSRGCPFQCSFCLWPDMMYGHRQRYRSAKNVVDEMETLVNKYGVKEVRFDDDTFALRKEHVLGISNEIMRRGLHKKLRWACFGHASQNDYEIYESIKKAGCFRIDFGIESGSQRVLDAACKKLDVNKAKETVKLCKKAGLEVYCDFMIGFPGETDEDVRKSLDLALEMDPDFIQVSFVIPYPGTRMHADGVKSGYLIYPDDWEKYNCQHVLIKTGPSQEQIEKYFFLFWRKFYLRPRLIARNALKMFSSPQNFKRILLGFISFMERYFK